MICNYDKYEDLANYRIDRITGIRLLDTPVKPQNKVTELKNGFNLPKHMAEHIYMFTGDSVKAVFRAKRSILNEIMDWFGTEVQFSDITPEEITVNVVVNEQAMRHWAMQYARQITVISPQRLVDLVKEDIREAAGKYKN